MVEPIIYFGISFAIAIVLALIVLPLIHNRRSD
jgi:hypothetical protein